MAARAGLASRSFTSLAMAVGSTAGTSARAGACTGRPPRFATRSASRRPSRLSSMAMLLPCMGSLFDSRLDPDDVVPVRARPLLERPVPRPAVGGIHHLDGQLDLAGPGFAA